MIDFHTHILPGMDDGSRDTAESLEMLRRSQAQGVDTVVLTPHFYARRESIADFCIRRQTAYEALRQAQDGETLPALFLGAEVRYFEGMTRADDLQKLCIGSYLLVEMPFEPWSRRTVQEVQNLPAARGITPILAHIERYMALPHWEEAVKELTAGGCLLQMNAEAFLGPLRGRRARGLLRQGWADLLGSDCHNTTSRPPNLGEIRRRLEGKTEDEIFQGIDCLGMQILHSAGA